MEQSNSGLDDSQRSLRERMPEYLGAFGIGLGATVAIGIGVWAVTTVSLASGIGHTIFLYGVAVLVSGGVSGGGYTNLGARAVDAGFGMKRLEGPFEDVEPTHSESDRARPQNRLRPGHRTQANPKAFWQVVGGGIYIAIGFVIVFNWA